MIIIKSKLYVLDPEGILFKQFSKIDVEKLNITFARKLDTLLTRVEMTNEDALLVDSENVESWENGKSLADQLPNGMKVFATTVEGGRVIRVGNPIDISLLYKKINEENHFVGQFLDEVPDRVKRQQSIDTVLNIRDKNRYKSMDNIIDAINNREPDEIVYKEWNDPHKGLEIDLEDVEELTASSLDQTENGDLTIKLDDAGVSTATDEDWDNLVVEIEEVETIDFDDETEEGLPEIIEDEVVEEIDLEGISLEEEEELAIDTDVAVDTEPSDELIGALDAPERLDHFEEESEERIVVPFESITQVNYQLKPGEERVIREGSDGWIQGDDYLTAMDEIVEVGPETLEEIAYDIKERHVSYLPKGTVETITQGVVGLLADGEVIVREPTHQVVLIGAGEEAEETTEKPKKRRRRRRKRSRPKKKQQEQPIPEFEPMTEVVNQEETDPGTKDVKPDPVREEVEPVHLNDSNLSLFDALTRGSNKPQPKKKERDKPKINIDDLLSQIKG